MIPDNIKTLPTKHLMRVAVQWSIYTKLERFYPKEIFEFLKSVSNKKYAPKLILVNEKKIEKDSDDFWHRKLTLKVKFWHFLTPPHYINSQNSIIFGKDLSIPLPWKLDNPYYHSTQTSCGNLQTMLNLWKWRTLKKLWLKLPNCKKKRMNWQFG